MKPFRIHTKYYGNVPDFLAAQLLVIIKKKIVELPKLALPISRDNCGRCQPSMFVAFEGKIFMNNFDFSRVLLEHLLEYRYQTGTGRSFKIAEHGDHHRSFNGSLERTEGVYRLDKIQSQDFYFFIGSAAQK